MIVDTGTANIFVQQHGSGEPLMLVHGLGMSSALWVNQIPAFSQRYRTVAIDLRGFGQSSRPQQAGAYRIETLAEDVAAVIQQLGIEGCHFLGTSMGGFVGQALALVHPGLCRSLILCHTAPRMSIPADVLAERIDALGSKSLEQYAEIVVEQACSADCDPAVRSWIAAMIANNDKRAYTQVLTEGLSDFDASGELGRIKMPTLVITGECDKVLPPEGGRELARLIPSASLVEIAGVGHLGYAEKPEVFNNAVLSFLSQKELKKGGLV